MRPEDLPEWVWQMVDTIHDYEDVHPKLYRMLAADDYSPYPCLGEPLTKLIPSDVAEIARVMRARAARQPATSTPTQGDDPA